MKAFGWLLLAAIWLLFFALFFAKLLDDPRDFLDGDLREAQRHQAALLAP